MEQLAVYGTGIYTLKIDVDVCTKVLNVSVDAIDINVYFYISKLRRRIL